MGYALCDDTNIINTPADKPVVNVLIRVCCVFFRITYSTCSTYQSDIKQMCKISEEYIQKSVQNYMCYSIDTSAI